MEAALLQAIYNRLSGDSTLTALLATYAGAPAIFSGDPVPQDAVPPYVVLSGTVGDESDDQIEGSIRTVLYQVACYVQRLEAGGQSVLPIATIAERLRTLLHRSKLSVSGFTPIFESVSGPIVNDDEEHLGRILTVSFKLGS